MATITKEEYLKHTGELTDWDQEVYEELISVELTPEQRGRIVEPPVSFEFQKEVLGVHWHPEIVPFDLITERINRTFPAMEKQLLIPTQHNQMLTYGDYAGVEIDCYSKDFNRKVQFLVHFHKDKIERANVFNAMLEHTFRYRSSQFFELLDAVLDTKYEYKLREAIKKTAADEELVEFAKIYTNKVKMLVNKNYNNTPSVSIKNKLLPNYIILLKEFYDESIVNKALVLLKEVKKVVKRNFKLDFFYETNEFIEEIRSIGGGIVIPHPEQFWPVLLADYDIDGIEVWNPQSREFTKFLIDVVINKNKHRKQGNAPVLVFMGDDTHLGEKLKKPEHQNKEKASREIGIQTAWDDIEIKKSLILGNFSRGKVIDDYKERLASY